MKERVVLPKVAMFLILVCLGMHGKVRAQYKLIKASGIEIIGKAMEDSVFTDCEGREYMVNEGDVVKPTIIMCSGSEHDAHGPIVNRIVEIKKVDGKSQIIQVEVIPIDSTEKPIQNFSSDQAKHEININ